MKVSITIFFKSIYDINVHIFKNDDINQTFMNQNNSNIHLYFS